MKYLVEPQTDDMKAVCYCECNVACECHSKDSKK